MNITFNANHSSNLQLKRISNSYKVSNQMCFGSSLPSDVTQHRETPATLKHYAFQQIRTLADLPKLQHLSTLLVPAHNEEKTIESFLENTYKTVLPQSSDVLQVLLICNGCTDQTVAKAKAWAEKNGVMVRMGETIKSPISPNISKKMVLDISVLQTGGKDNAIASASDIFQSWQSLPVKFATIDADCRFTEASAAAVMQNRTDNQQFVIINPIQFSPKKSAKDLSSPEKINSKDLNRLYWGDELWNFLCQKYEKLPPTSGQCMIGSAEALIGMNKAIFQKTPEMNSKDHMLFQLAQSMGYQIHSLPGAFIWAMSHPMTAAGKHIRQQARWNAGKKQVQAFYGPDYKTPTHGLPPDYMDDFMRSLRLASRLAYKIDLNFWKFIGDRKKGKRVKHLLNDARSGEPTTWKVER